MFNKKNFMLNCDVCDTRKMKEEDYSSYEKMMINAEVMIVNEASKSILNRLPITINQDSTLDLTNDVEVDVQTINGSYEITGNTAVKEHTLLIVNGTLKIHPGTESVLSKYEKIMVNGSLRSPKSLEGYLNKLSVNGFSVMYPDNCVILEDTFVLDKYFPLRVKEGSRYYVDNMVVIEDQSIDLEKLVQKNVQFITKRLIVPENMVEKCVALFDEKVDFVVVPSGMTLVCGETVLNEQLVEKAGSKIYVYGPVKLDEYCDIEVLEKGLEKLIVNGTITLKKSQEEILSKLNVEYSQLEFSWEGRIIENTPSARVDKCLLESSPQKVLVRNVATIKIADDVTTELLLDRLVIRNCAKVSCSENQESVIAVISENVARIGEICGEEADDTANSFKDLYSAKIVNAESYIM